MMIVDFDAKFFEYVRAWLVKHPGMKPEAVEERYNELMTAWLETPAKWLDGIAPGAYFSGIRDADELLNMVEAYDAAGIGLPEPLYTCVTQRGAETVGTLSQWALDEGRSTALRGTALSMLDEIGGVRAECALISLLLHDGEEDELSEMAAEALSRRMTPELCALLLDEYEACGVKVRDRILDACSACKPAPRKLGEYLVECVIASGERRAYYAALLGKIGYTDAVDTLIRLSKLTELGYPEYLEIRNTIEMLGGDPGEERLFQADEDYERLRNL